MVRARGLSESLKESLGEQNVGIVYVRETQTCGIVLRSETSDINNECRKTLGEIAGEVVPYLKINKAQAERLLKELAWRCIWR